MPIEYKVRQGDCISSISDKYGFFPNTIWNNSANAELKKKRQDPNILKPGDIVVIPDKQLKEEEGNTGVRHKFQRKGVPEKLKIVLLDSNDQPRANQNCILLVDEELTPIKSNSEGRIEVPIAPNAKSGKLIIGEEDDPFGEEYVLALGHMDPISKLSGVQARLKNLGFYDDEIESTMGPDTIQAIMDFQLEYGLEQTGELTEETREKLKSVHGF